MGRTAVSCLTAGGRATRPAMIDDPRSLLVSLFDSAVWAARADQCMEGALPPPVAGRTVVVGAGKAASAMAAFVESRWSGPIEGIVVAPYGHGSDTRRIETVEASHPVPDEAGIDAARRILDLVQGLGEGDRVLALVSGGGSSLLVAPAPGLTLGDKRAVNEALLRSGAAIGEMNCVRKHLSAIKGGRLAAAAWPAEVVALAISDVPGDDPAVIASGPTVGDPGTRHDALAILERYRLDVPGPVRTWLECAKSETPKPGDAALSRSTFTILARARDSLEAAAGQAIESGAGVTLLGDNLEGEASALGRLHAGLARNMAASLLPRPHVILSGGETTVTRTGTGTGGRNQEYLLALAVALDGEPGIHALACDTDGIDGSTLAAGAVTDPGTMERARRLGLQPAEALAAQDSGRLFHRLEDHIVTGPTCTNVNDFRAILIT